MSYLVLARKWRPLGFADLVGQEPISRILSNAIEQGRIAHAYLFSGPRGVGKTSTARILAKAMNCEKGPTPVPCGVCTSCKGVADGSSIDVMEIDGASNNSVNDIRDLRERVKYAPAGGRFKVYIIDEAHMLSDAAFNALLKTLEEPPPHVVFVLATTAARKIPATVLSRCQHLPFRKIPGRTIRGRLKMISDSEGIHISDSALELIARAADGSMRDSLTILDQVSAFSADISESEVKDLLGVADFGALAELSAAVIGGERRKIIEVIAELTDRGTDLKSFAKDLMQFFRDLLVAKVVRKPEEILDIGENEIGRIREILAATSAEHLTLLLSEMIKAEYEARIAFSPRVSLEMSLIKASYLATLKPVGEAIENIEALIAGGSAPETGPCLPAGRRRSNGVMDRSEKAEDIPKAAAATEPEKAQTGDISEAPPLPSDLSDKSDGSDLPAGPAYRTGRQAGLSEEPSAQMAAEPSPDETVSGDEGFWSRVIQKIETDNHPLACKLSGAEARTEGNAVIVTFNGGLAVHADSVKKNIDVIEKAASEVLNGKVSVRIETAKKKVLRKRELKEKLLSEPFVKEAIELFEGRIVDIGQMDKSTNGGKDV